ncbi:glycosyltransferase family 39 protein [Streptomyces antimicrobicus]|uniref:Glycosyltransferase family 39 protein n=1 Tax=Streptomyces antimicrobicus TaxID=2883108 RepID=A0ABS8B3B6_9ACTN|nr:glycosyltransferase family 39 protein [Streptomyces antimicrobicus]MCB5179108.1 glycosyltransferase family 39 protein [Streptomyces antimicrobicus]
MTTSSTAVTPGTGAGRPGSAAVPAGPHAGPDATPTPALARFDWLWAALLTFAVACTGGGVAQPWRDELASWHAARRGTGDLVDMLGNVDAVSGVYYLVLHGWVSLAGDSPAMLRMPSALAMAGAAAFVVLTARRLFDRRVAVFAGVLFALVPAVSKYGQEARSYAFVVLAVSAATWLLLRALERPTAKRWLPYAVAVAAAGLFHIVSLLVLLPHGLIVLGRWWGSRSRRLLVGYVLTVAVALLPVVPLVLLGRRQVGRQISWLTAPHLRDLAGTWSNLVASPLTSYALLAAALLPLAWTRGRRPAAELALVAALPIGVAWVISHGSTSYFLDRYLLFTLPAWVVLAAAGLGALRPRALGVTGLVVLVALGMTDQRHLRTKYAKDGTDGKRVAEVIAKDYKPGDGFAPVRGSDRVFMIDFTVEYYLPGKVKLKDVFAERSAVADDDLFPVECEQAARCATDLNGTQRVWVVTWSGTSNPYHKFPEAQQKALKDHYKPVRTTKLGNLQVTLVERAR